MLQRFFKWSLLVALAVSVLVILAVSATPSSDDWPQWRGADRNGQSSATGLLREWPEGGPKLAWQTTGVGNGYSSLAVVGDRIYTLGDIDGTQYVVAINRRDGSPVWKTRIGPPWEDEYVGARSTPTIDGDRLYALGTEGDLVCLDSASGTERWRRSLTNDFGGRLMLAQGRIDWKYAESPLVDGNKVIVTPGAAEAAMVALNKDTGEEIWRARVPSFGERGLDGAAYSSIVVSNGAGVRQYVQLMGRGVVGIDASNGRFLWGYNQVANNIANIPTPLVHGDYVFASTGYRTGAALIKLSKDGDDVKAEEVYFLQPNVMQNHHGGLILHEGFVYSGTGHNRGYPLCVNFENGEKAWGPVRNSGKGSAAVAYADGHLYYRYQDGLVVLVEANPTEYREKGSFRIPDINQFSWSHPVIVDGRLYLREQDRLYVYDISR